MMNWTRKTKVILILMVLLVAGGVILYLSSDVWMKPETVLKILPDEADFQMKDFVYTDVGADQSTWEVRSQSARFSRKQNLAFFDKVLIKLTTPEGRVVNMTGDSGSMQTETKTLEIRGNVVIVTDTDETFWTDYLHYDDARKTVMTDAPVRIKTPRLQLDGVGMTLNIEKGELLISKPVRAVIN